MYRDGVLKVHNQAPSLHLHCIDVWMDKTLYLLLDPPLFVHFSAHRPYIYFLFYYYLYALVDYLSSISNNFDEKRLWVHMHASCPSPIPWGAMFCFFCKARKSCKHTHVPRVVLLWLLFEGGIYIAQSFPFVQHLNKATWYVVAY